MMESLCGTCMFVLVSECMQACSWLHAWFVSAVFSWFVRKSLNGSGMIGRVSAESGLTQINHNDWFGMQHAGVTHTLKRSSGVVASEK